MSNLKQEFDSLGKAIEEFKVVIGDEWHAFKVIIAELLVWLALNIMPEGAEKAKMEQVIFDYVLWVEQK